MTCKMLISMLMVLVASNCPSESISHNNGIYGIMAYK